MTEQLRLSSSLRVGIFSIGLEAYWAQFPGLKDRLKQWTGNLAVRLARPGVEVVDLGLIDNSEKALAAGHEFRRSDVDLIFLHATTYALSSTVLPVVRRAKVPVIVLNLAPGPAIDYSSFNRLTNRTEMTGEWLAWCQSCPIPEIANVFQRCRIPFVEVTGMLEGDPISSCEIEHWVEAARVANVMEHNRLGLMGRYYGGMLDVYSDLTLQCATFGGHVELIEVDELTALRSEVTETEMDDRIDYFFEAFDYKTTPPAPN